MKTQTADQIGVCSWSLQATGPQDLAEKVNALGLTKVQLGLTPHRDDPGTCWRRAHHNLAGAVATDHVVVQRAAFAQGYADHLPLGLLGGLADCFGHFAGLALAEANAALLIPDHNQCCKTEALTALDHLRHAVDVH